MKQAIIIRTDLKMNKGKIASQASHASISAFLKARRYSKDMWLDEGMKKVVLKVQSNRELIDYFKKAKAMKLPCALIMDRGLTQIKSGSKTAVGIGPAKDDIIDKVTGKLKLL